MAKETVGLFYVHQPERMLGETNGSGYFTYRYEAEGDAAARAAAGEIVPVYRTEIIKGTNREKILALLDHCGFVAERQVIATYFPNRLDRERSEESADVVWRPGVVRRGLTDDEVCHVEKRTGRVHDYFNNTGDLPEDE